MKTAFVITALFLSLPALAGSAGATVPDRFVGHWAGSPESCRSDADDLVLRIAHHRISYWESEGPIKAVVVRGDTEIALISELSGEGETWLSTAKFKLSRDGRRLVDDTTVPGQAVVRYKCPGSVGTRPNNSSRSRFAARLNSGVRRHWKIFANEGSTAHYFVFPRIHRADGLRRWIPARVRRPVKGWRHIPGGR